MYACTTFFRSSPHMRDIRSEWTSAEQYQSAWGEAVPITECYSGEMAHHQRGILCAYCMCVHSKFDFDLILCYSSLWIEIVQCCLVFFLPFFPLSSDGSTLFYFIFFHSLAGEASLTAWLSTLHEKEWLCPGRCWTDCQQQRHCEFQLQTEHHTRLGVRKSLFLFPSDCLMFQAIVRGHCLQDAGLWYTENYV